MSGGNEKWNDTSFYRGRGRRSHSEIHARMLVPFVEQFMKHCCIRSDDELTRARDLFEEYHRYVQLKTDCTQTREAARNFNAFARRVNSLAPRCQWSCRTFDKVRGYCVTMKRPPRAAKSCVNADAATAKFLALPDQGWGSFWRREYLSDVSIYYYFEFLK